MNDKVKQYWAGAKRDFDELYAEIRDDYVACTMTMGLMFAGAFLILFLLLISTPQVLYKEFVLWYRS
jgi:hypothetical protein